MTRLSARVSGNIRRVAVQDFQRVKAGDLLMEIDPADYEAVIAQAEANVSAARAVLDNLENQKAFQRAAISQAEAQRLSAVARAVQTARAGTAGHSASRSLAGTKKLERRRTTTRPGLLSRRAGDHRAQRQRSMFWAVNRPYRAPCGCSRGRTRARLRLGARLSWLRWRAWSASAS
jgi:multidrug resistance efflux pump